MRALLLEVLDYEWEPVRLVTVRAKALGVTPAAAWPVLEAMDRDGLCQLALDEDGRRVVRRIA